jgi:hypothetical protein
MKLQGVCQKIDFILNERFFSGLSLLFRPAVRPYQRADEI